jgi:hypothetical protein
MINDQLAPTIKEIAQRPFALGTIKNIFLFDPRHGESAPFRRDAIGVLRQLFFVLKVSQSLGEPLLPRYDRWMRDGGGCHGY